MSKIQQLRALVTQRLTLAAEEIFGVVERTIAEYEEEASRSKLELQRQQNLLDAVLKPEIKLHKADHHPPNVSEGNISIKQEEPSLNLDYDNLKPPQMTNQSRDDVMEFIFSPVGIKSEHDQKQTLSVCCVSTQNAGAGGEPIPDTSSDQRTTQQREEVGGAPGASSGCQSLTTDCYRVESENWNSGGHNDLGDGDWGEIESSHLAFKAPEVMTRLPTVQERKHKKSDLKSPSQSNAGPHRCRVCGKSFTYITPLKNHVQKHIKDTDFCGICGEHFPSEESLRLHLQTHVASKACEFCHKHFGSHADMVKHLRIHTGEKPYICSICGRGFHLNGNLKKHMIVHTGEKPFLCTFCGKGFRQNVGLKYHMATHTGQKPHQCHICGKEFPMKYGLTHHLKIHSDERPYKCSVCGKGCYQISNLKSHMLSHLKK